MRSAGCGAAGAARALRGCILSRRSQELDRLCLRLQARATPRPQARPPKARGPPEKEPGVGSLGTPLSCRLSPVLPQPCQALLPAPPPPGLPQVGGSRGPASAPFPPPRPRRGRWALCLDRPPSRPTDTGRRPDAGSRGWKRRAAPGEGGGGGEKGRDRSGLAAGVTRRSRALHILG